MLVLALLVAWQPGAVAAESPVVRVGGADHVATAVAVSQRQFAAADTVVIGRVDQYPDALGGAPLAATLDAPLLLSPSDLLPAAVAAEISRLSPQQVVLLGGPAALSPTIEQALDGLGVATVRRIAGDNRFATAALVAADVTDRSGAAQAYLALGEHADPSNGWPDAVSVSTLAARQQRPILLTRRDSLPASTADALAATGITKVTLVGGTAVIADIVRDELVGLGLDVDRLAGPNRFATSRAVAERGLAEGLSPTTVWLASGAEFQSALAASPAAGAAGQTMVLFDPNGWGQQPTWEWMMQNAALIDGINVVGDDTTLPAALLDDARALLAAGAVAAPVAGAPQRPAPQPGEVRLELGANFQAVVNANPPGTRYRIAAGVHHAQSVAPKDGDTFTGEPGAVMSGTELLDPSRFVRTGGVWVLDGRTEQPLSGGHGETVPGRERDAIEFDLWAGDRRLQHAPTRAAVNRPGTYYYDWQSGRITLYDDPSTLPSVEFSVAAAAFRSDARDVTIQFLTVQRYAAPAQHGAIHAAEGTDWEVAAVTARENHGYGIRTGPGMWAHHNRIVANGQLGIGGQGDDLLIEYNEIAGNLTLGYNWGWEGGATKFTETTGAVFQFNWVHDNAGPGPWFDIDNRDATIRSNVVENNAMAGILYEISYDAEIYANTIRGNGAEAYGDLGAGVWISNSAGVEVYDNLLEGNRFEVLATHDNRGSGRYGKWETADLYVHDNSMRIGYGAVGLRVPNGENEYYTSRGNRFEDNTYQLDANRTTNFYWGEMLDIRGWQARGNDRDSLFLDPAAAASLPASLTTLVGAVFGA